MREIERIADQLQRAHEGPAWHGPALRAVLTGVTAEQAAARPIPAAHTIWELVRHIAAWETGVLRGIASGHVYVSDAENFPSPVETTEGAWRLALNELTHTHGSLRQAILRLEDADLDRQVTSGEETYSIYFLLHGAIQHCLYHAGQIQIMKAAIR